MQESAKRRLGLLGGHFTQFSGYQPSTGQPSSIDFDAALLQRLLEHDNWETRAQMKELMKDPLFIPYVCQQRVCLRTGSSFSQLVNHVKDILCITSGLCAANMTLTCETSESWLWQGCRLCASRAWSPSQTSGRASDVQQQGRGVTCLTSLACTVFWGVCFAQAAAFLPYHDTGPCLFVSLCTLHALTLSFGPEHRTPMLNLQAWAQAHCRLAPTRSPE